MTAPLQAAILGHVVAILRPLARAAESSAARDELIDQLGWNVQALTGLQLADVDSALGECATALTAAEALVTEGFDDLARAGKHLAALGKGVAAIVGVVRAWDPPAGLPDLGGLLAEDLVCTLLDGHLATALPRLRAVLDLAGVRSTDTRAAITRTVNNQVVTIREQRERPRFSIDPLARFLQDPGRAIRVRLLDRGEDDDEVDVGETAHPDLVAAVVGPIVADLLRQVGLLAWYGLPAPDTGSEVAGGTGRELTPEERVAAAHLLHVMVEASAGSDDDTLGGRLHVMVGLAREPLAGGRFGAYQVVVLPVGGLDVEVSEPPVTASARLAGTTGPIVVSSSGVDLPGQGSAARATVDAELQIDGSRPGEPLYRLGSPSGTRLDIGGVAWSLAAVATPAGASIAIEAGLVESRLAITAGDDGLLGAILPREPVEVNLDLGFVWSPDGGIRLRGAAGLERTFALDYVLGPLTVQRVVLSIRANQPAGVEALLSMDALLRLGPVVATIGGIGLRAALTAGDQGGAAGPFGVEVALKPPTGVGIAVDAEVVKGGGYLSLDPATGTYAGVLELQFASVSLSAVALLNTRFPDGRPGFSLVVLVSFRFPTGVPLGFGFSLTAVGGLIGINRTIDDAPLRAGLASGSLDSLLFPPDVRTNGPKIVADIGRFFPVREGQHVVGPAVELSWGTPTIVFAQLGIYIELPSPVRVLVVGRLVASLPSAEREVAHIQVDVVGIVDFSGRRVAIDGVLRHSFVGPFDLSGSMALRASWGDPPAFLLAVGGFHPVFRPPADFPALRRITLDLAKGDNPRLRLTAYMAITSNTVQLGAAIDAHAEFSLLGATIALDGHLSFDALVTLEPLSFLVSISAWVTVSANRKPLLGVRLDIELTGPEPWRAVCEATVVFLGTHRKEFTITVGEPRPPYELEPVDLPGLVREALATADAWAAEAPAGTRSLVVLAERDGDAGADGPLVLHPLGALTVRQRRAPLSRTVTRVGPRVVGTDQVVEIDAVRIAGEVRPHTPVEDFFAPGEFTEMTEQRRLSAPSFERWVGGARVAAPGLAASPVTRSVTGQYETLVVREAPTSPAVAGVAAAGGVAAVTGPGRARVLEGRTDPIPAERIAVQAAGGAAGLLGVAARAVDAEAAAEHGVVVDDVEYVVGLPTDAGTGLGLGVTPVTGSWETFGRYADAGEALANLVEAQTADVAPRLRVLEAAEART